MEVSTVSTTAIQMHVEHDPTGYPCFYIHGLSGDQKHDEAKLAEYVRLFEAAPELLALVKDMVDALDPQMIEVHDNGGLAALGYNHGETCCVCRARNLVAKAEGR